MSENMKKDSVDVENKFKNVKSLDEWDFDELQKMVRGDTPQDIKEKCLNLCKDYLAGNWNQQTVDSIQVERITGGIVNQIYHCSIREPNEKESVPQEVSIKILNENDKKREGIRLKKLVISLIFSEKNLGPKIYGIFEEGIIQKFYKHRSFIGEEQKNAVLLRKVGHTLAKIHSLELPIKKEPQLIISIEDIINDAFEKQGIHKYIEEYNCETLKKYDLRTEFNWIKGVIERLKSPLIFNHGDFRSSNLMITEPNDEIVICDYDMSRYGYRGWDFGWLMREWGNRKQMDLKTIEDLPFNDEFRPFIEVYVEECNRIHDKSYAENPINSVDHILKEVKVFHLYSYLWLSVHFMKGIWDTENSSLMGNAKVLMEFMENGLKNFITVKNLFNSQKLFD